MTPQHPRQYWRGEAGMMDASRVAPDCAVARAGGCGDRGDQRSGRRGWGCRTRGGSRVRQAWSRKKSRWRRRTQQHPFVAGGDFSVRRNRPSRIQQQQQQQQHPRQQQRFRGGGGSRTSGPSRVSGRRDAASSKNSCFAGQSMGGFQGFQPRREGGDADLHDDGGRGESSSRRHGAMPSCSRDVSGGRSGRGPHTTAADSLMYSLEGRRCPPAPRHEPQYLREVEWPFKDWRASPGRQSTTFGNSPGKQGASPSRGMKQDNLTLSPSSPSMDLPKSVIEAVQCRASLISHFQEENGVLRAKLREMEARLAAIRNCPHSPSVAENSPVREWPCSIEKSEF